MTIANSFRELNVYRLAREGAQQVFVVTNDFPREERYSLTDQIRRSSRAVTAMLAEAWARRRYRPAFINKINEALGETVETQAWLDHALDASCLGSERFQSLDAKYQHIGGMLARMIERAEDFCKEEGGRIREDSSDEEQTLSDHFIEDSAC